MSIAELSVKRPVTVVMVMMVFIVLGGVALSQLSLDLLPDIEIPAAAVVVNYEGAGPYEIESLITRPIEEVLATVGNVDTISSRCERGRATIVTMFTWGTNLDMALLDIRDKLDLVKPYLPDDADSPLLLKFDPSAVPILEFGLSGNMPDYELRDIAENQIKNKLERLDGVASVDIVGGRKREIQVTLDIGKIRAYNISLEQIIRALQASNLNLPAGEVIDGSKEYIIRTEGEYKTVDEIKDLVIAVGPAGIRKLGDIAKVEDTYKDAKVLSRVNGKESVSLLIQKEAQSNTVQVAEKVKAALKEIAKELEDVELTMVADTSVFVRDAVDAVKSNALMGGALAVAILLAFLRSVGSTFIISIAIPISVIATFVLMYFNNMTLNLLSLGGLALGVGMLVDNSIVVLENIFQHSERGLSPTEAAIVGSNEVITAVSASNLTTIIVFLPVVFMQGMASEIFRDLSLTVTFSLLCSLLISQTLVPMLASRMRRNVLKEQSTEGIFSKATGVIPNAIDKLSNGYSRLLPGLLRNKKAIFIIAGVGMVISLAIVPFIGKEFLPAFDEGTIRVQVKLERGYIVEETNKVVTGLERDISRLAYVDTILSQIGSESRGEEGSLTIKLVPRSERRLSTLQAVEEIRNIAKAYPTADINVSSTSVFGDMAGGGDPLVIQLRSNDLKLIEEKSKAVAKAISGVKGTRDIKSSVEEARPELQIKVKREKASTYGLSIYQIASAVRIAINGQVATRFRTGGQEIDVIVKLDDKSREGFDCIGQVPISTPLGTIIPLKEVAEVIQGTSPDTVQRLDQVRVVSVSSQIYGRALGNIVRDCEKAIKDLNLPDDIDIIYGGENEWMTEAMDDLVKALILAVFLVYMLLASQFESFWQPFVIIFSIPFAFTGVIWALLVTHNTLNVISFIGIIMLAGIVVNNAIVLIDYINQLRRRGIDREEAIVEAGRSRMRPILMTTSTTVLGLFPIAFGLGAGGELLAPVAIVVVSGLTLSTFMTLFMIPTMYIFLEDIIFKYLVRKESNIPEGSITPAD